MNIISRIRRQIANNGSVTLSFDDYNQLQKEWIKRCVDAETLESHNKEQHERVIDAVIDLGLIENDKATCDLIREKLKGGE